MDSRQAIIAVLASMALLFGCIGGGPAPGPTPVPAGPDATPSGEGTGINESDLPGEGDLDDGYDTIPTPPDISDGAAASPAPGGTFTITEEDLGIAEDIDDSSDLDSFALPDSP